MEESTPTTGNTSYLGTSWWTNFLLNDFSRGSQNLCIILFFLQRCPRSIAVDIGNSDYTQTPLENSHGTYIKRSPNSTGTSSSQCVFFRGLFPKDPFCLYVLRKGIFPKTILFWDQSYSREGSGFLRFVDFC